VFRPGDKVGDYEIVARFKSGGMATLYLARRTGASGFAKHVAIKVVHPHLAEDPTFVRMFVDEALLSARIVHPNVVHVEELREVDGQHFLVMEWVAGCSLAQLMRQLAKRQRRLTPQLAVHIAVRIADGLHAAHELKDEQGQSLGVVHRDVSPQNVLLAWQGHVKLIDFGVAKARDRSHQTTGASLKGKIRYMAPEQAFGHPIDRRCDIYALGVLLWEMLTMRRMFEADNDLLLLEKVRHPEIRPPSEYVPDVPPDLDRVVMKALAADPDARFRTAQKLRRRLADAMPRAVALDSSHLSELLHAAMPEQIDKQRRLLPQTLSASEIDATPGAEDAEDDEEHEDALETMTTSAVDLASFVDFPSEDPSEKAPAQAPAASDDGAAGADGVWVDVDPGGAGSPEPAPPAPPPRPSPPVQQQMPPPGPPAPATARACGTTPVLEPPRRRIAPLVAVAAGLALAALGGVGLVLAMESGEAGAAESTGPVASDPEATGPEPTGEPDDGEDDGAQDEGIVATDSRDAGTAAEEGTAGTEVVARADEPEEPEEPEAADEPQRPAVERPRPRPRPTMRPTPTMDEPTTMGGVPLADDFGF